MSTTTSLEFQGHTVRIDIDDVNLRPGMAVHELSFQLKVHGLWLSKEPPSYNVLTLAARVSVGPQLAALATAATTLTLYGWPSNEGLRVLISDEQLIAIEVARVQGDVEFTLDLAGTLLDVSPLPAPMTTQVLHRVARSRWLELLD